MTDEERKNRAQNHGPRAQFTAHELDVIDYFCAGLTAMEIAIEVRKSKNAIDQMLKAFRIYSGTVNGVCFALWCVKHGVVKV